MKFVVDIPDEVFWKIAARAEVFDQKVPDYTTDLLISAAAVPVPTETDPVFRLWRAGYTDKQIARELNMTNLAVATRRRRHYRLPANRRGVAEGEKSA